MRDLSQREMKAIRLALRWRQHVIWHAMSHQVGGYTKERKEEHELCRKLYMEFSEMGTFRENTIKYIVPNLRNRWKAELAPYTDNQIAAVYEMFGQSFDHGDNDRMFPCWFDLIGQQPK